MPLFSRIGEWLRTRLLAPVFTGIAQQVVQALPVERRVQVVHRLSPSVYADLEARLPKPGIAATNPEAAALFQSGVEFTLRKLREGYLDADA